MDELARYNQERWEELAGANVLYSRPLLDLTPELARAVLHLDREGVVNEVAGKAVLCLASGGGQQSAALGLLGAQVTVFDLTETQLQRDRDAAAHYGLQVRTLQGDMRDLSVFEAAAFDIVWHPYSVNFVPDPVQVFREVARVLRVGGLYRLDCANPFILGLDETQWNGASEACAGYPLRMRYADGEMQFDDPDWIIGWADGTEQRVTGPREFRHTLHRLLTGLARHGFMLLGAWEHTSREPNPVPGTWEHFISIAPPWLTFWCRYQPDAFKVA